MVLENVLRAILQLIHGLVALTHDEVIGNVRITQAAASKVEALSDSLPAPCGTSLDDTHCRSCNRHANDPENSSLLPFP